MTVRKTPLYSPICLIEAHLKPDVRVALASFAVIWVSFGLIGALLTWMTCVGDWTALVYLALLCTLDMLALWFEEPFSAILFVLQVLFCLGTVSTQLRDVGKLTKKLVPIVAAVVSIVVQATIAPVFRALIQVVRLMGTTLAQIVATLFEMVIEVVSSSFGMIQSLENGWPLGNVALCELSPQLKHRLVLLIVCVMVLWYYVLTRRNLVHRLLPFNGNKLADVWEVLSHIPPRQANTQPESLQKKPQDKSKPENASQSQLQEQVPLEGLLQIPMEGVLRDPQPGMQVENKGL